MYYEDQHDIERRSRNERQANNQRIEYQKEHRYYESTRGRNDRHGKNQGVEFPNVERYHESTRVGNKRGFDHLKTERGSPGGLL